MGGGLLRPVNPRLPSINRVITFNLNERESVGSSSQREYGNCDRAQRRDMLRESQQRVDSETFAQPAVSNRNADTIERPRTIPDAARSDIHWLAEQRARLFALRRVEGLEADRGELRPPREALRADDAIVLRKPDGASLTSQLSTGQDCEQIAEMAGENRNIVTVSFWGRRYRALLDSGAMVSLVGTEIAEQCRER